MTYYNFGHRCINPECAKVFGVDTPLMEGLLFRHFPCPYCRQDNPVPSPQGVVDRIAVRLQMEEAAEESRRQAIRRREMETIRREEETQQHALLSIDRRENNRSSLWWQNLVPKGVAISQAAWERRRRIIGLRDVLKMTYGQIAVREDISTGRARQIYEAGKRARIKLSPVETYMRDMSDVMGIADRVRPTGVASIVSALADLGKEMP